MRLSSHLTRLLMYALTHSSVEMFGSLCDVHPETEDATRGKVSPKSK